jgi:myosin heavy subunit
VATNLGVSAEKLAESMTVRDNKIRNEVFRVPLKPEEAADVRDAIAKALYGRQFNWLVERINRSISKSASTNARSFIGVLDIFGFENFTVRSLLIGLRISIETRVLTSRGGCVCAMMRV